MINLIEVNLLPYLFRFFFQISLLNYFFNLNIKFFQNVNYISSIQMFLQQAKFTTQQNSIRYKKRIKAHTESIDDLVHALSEHILHIAAGLRRSATVRIKVRMSEGNGKSQHAAVRVYEIDELSVGGSEVALRSGIHVQWVGRVQAGYPSHLRYYPEMLGKDS